MPSDGQTPLTSRQTVWQLPLGWLSETTATTITFALLLLLLLTGAQGRSKNRNAGIWTSSGDRVAEKEPLGMWLSAKATFYDRYDNWLNINSLMEHWEVTIKLPRASSSLIEFTDPVTNLFVQVTPCSSPIKVRFHSERVALNSKLTPKEAFANRRNNDREIQSSGRDFYPALDSRLSGELMTASSSAARLMWITLSPAVNEKAAASVSFAPLPPANDIVNDYVTVRFFKPSYTQTSQYDYPPAPLHIAAPRVDYIGETNRLVVRVDLMQDDYDNSNTRQLSFCMVVNNVRPLPQWCSAQIGIPQMPYNRKIWANESAFHLPQGQFNYTCRRALYGRSPSDMELELPEALQRQAQRSADLDSPHLSPIYLNVYTINEDRWRLATAGTTLVLKLPTRTPKPDMTDKTLGLTDVNMERSLQSVISPSNGQCSCLLHVPVIFGRYFKRDADIFVITKKFLIRQPLEARVWPLIAASDRRWTCRQNSTERITFLPSSGHWLCRPNQPFNCPSNQEECLIETHMLELRSSCLPQKKANSNKTRSRCPVVKFHVGTRHGYNSSVRYLDQKLFVDRISTCNEISWLNSSNSKINNFKLQSNCLSVVLQKSMSHRRVKKGTLCLRHSYCWALKLVVAPGLTIHRLRQFFPDPTDFTFRIIILNKRKPQKACQCQPLNSDKCRLCVLKSLRLYRSSKHPCKQPTCQRVDSLARAMKGVTLSINHRRRRNEAEGRPIVLLQVYAASKNETCSHPVNGANLNTCLDVMTLVASRVVRAPNRMR